MNRCHEVEVGFVNAAEWFLYFRTLPFLLEFCQIVPAVVWHDLPFGRCLQTFTAQRVPLCEIHRVSVFDVEKVSLFDAHRVHFLLFGKVFLLISRKVPFLSIQRVPLFENSFRFLLRKVQSEFRLRKWNTVSAVHTLTADILSVSMICNFVPVHCGCGRKTSFGNINVTAFAEHTFVRTTHWVCSMYWVPFIFSPQILSAPNTEHSQSVCICAFVCRRIQLGSFPFACTFTRNTEMHIVFGLSFEFVEIAHSFRLHFPSDGTDFVGLVIEIGVMVHFLVGQLNFVLEVLQNSFLTPFEIGVVEVVGEHRSCERRFQLSGENCLSVAVTKPWITQNFRRSLKTFLRFFLQHLCEKSFDFFWQIQMWWETESAVQHIFE